MLPGDKMLTLRGFSALWGNLKNNVCHVKTFSANVFPFSNFCIYLFIILAKTNSSELKVFVLELDDILVFPSSFSNFIPQHATKHMVLHMMVLLYDSDKKLNVIKKKPEL